MTPTRSLAAACRLALPLSALWCAGAAQAAPVVTITSNRVVVDASASTGYSTDSTTTTSTSHSELLDATADATSFSRNQLDYGVAGGVTSFSNRLTQGRDGTRFDRSQAYDNSMLFTVGANTSYDLSGSYAVTDVGAAGRVYLYSYLRDVTASSFLLQSFQESRATTNEAFALGGSDGDRLNITNGSLTGQLTAGHQYQWFFNAFTNAVPDADSGATATGHITLRIGDRSDLDAAASAIPEPGTLALAGLSLAGLMLARRRRAGR